MFFFSQRRPRAFRHDYLYTDMRTEKFKDMERRVRNSRPDTLSRDNGNEALRGIFTSSVSHLGHGRRQRWLLPCICFMLVFVILILVVCEFLSAL